MPILIGAGSARSTEGAAMVARAATPFFRIERRLMSMSGPVIRQPSFAVVSPVSAEFFDLVWENARRATSGAHRRLRSGSDPCGRRSGPAGTAPEDARCRDLKGRRRHGAWG